MSGQAFSGDTGAAADCRMWISRGLWGSSPSSGCKLSGACFSYSGAEFARSWLGSSDLMGLRDLYLTPLPLSTRGVPAFSAKRKSPAPGWGGALGLLERVLPESKLYCFLLLGIDFFLGPRNPRG